MNEEMDRNRIVTERLKEMGFHLHPPDQVLYKYVTMEAAKLILGNGTLRYQTPDKFNDPLDPHFALIDMSNIIKQRAERLPTNIDRDNYIIETTKISREIIKKHVYTTGILCLSLSNTHTLMWSHYANAHTGICIGFKYLGIQADGVSAFKVKYDDEIKPMPILNPVVQDDNYIAMMNLLCRKAKVWEYEQEVRIAKIGKAGIYPIYPGYVSEIYFGVNTRGTDIQDIGKLLLDRGYKSRLENIGKMMLSDNKFELEIKPLSF